MGNAAEGALSRGSCLGSDLQYEFRRKADRAKNRGRHEFTREMFSMKSFSIVTEETFVIEPGVVSSWVLVRSVGNAHGTRTSSQRTLESTHIGKVNKYPSQYSIAFLRVTFAHWAVLANLPFS